MSAAGLATGIAEKARRSRLLIDVYGLEPDIRIVLAGIEEALGKEHLQQVSI